MVSMSWTRIYSLFSYKFKLYIIDIYYKAELFNRFYVQHFDFNAWKALSLRIWLVKRLWFNVFFTVRDQITASENKLKEMEKKRTSIEAEVQKKVTEILYIQQFLEGNYQIFLGIFCQSASGNHCKILSNHSCLHLFP